MSSLGTEDGLNNSGCEKEETGGPEKEIERLRAELEKEKLRVSGVIEKTATGYFRLDATGKFTHVNSAWLKMHGYENREDVIGKHFSTTRSEVDLEEVYGHIRDVIDGVCFEGRMFTRKRIDGSAGVDFFTVTPLMENGEVVGLEGFLLDQPDENYSRKALRESELKFTNLFSSMNEGVAIHRMIYNKAGEAVDYEIVDTNPAYHKHTGIIRSESVKKPSRQVYGVAEPPYLDIYDRVLRTGIPAYFETYFEPMEKYFNVNCFRYAEGMFATIFSDITGRRIVEKQMEEALAGTRKREKEVEALLRGASSVLGSEDFETAAKVIFYTCGELIGATSGYIALLSKDGSENDVLFLESGGMPCEVDESLPMPIRGLRAEAYKKGVAVYDNDFMNSEWAKYLPEGHVTLRNVIFAPLIIDGNAVGVMGLANKENGFDENDVRLTTAFGEIAAIALKNARAKEALLGSEEALKKAQEIGKIGSWEYYPEADRLVWSKEMFHIFGIDPSEDVPGYEEHKNLIHPDDWERFDKTVKSIAGDVTGFKFDFRIIRPDGSTRLILMIGEKNRIEKDAFGKMSGIMQDVTELKQAQEQARLSEEKLRIAVEGANEGMWEIDFIDSWVYFDKAATRMLGYGPDELEESLAFCFDIIHPDDRTGVENALNNYIEGKQEKYSTEFRIRMKNGDYKWVSSEGRMIKHSEHGRPALMVGIHKDISERKKAEQAIRESEAKYRALFDCSVEAFVIFELESNRYIDANRYALDMYGYTMDELRNLTPLDLSMEKEKTQLALDRLREEGFLEAQERIQRKKDGTPLPVEIYSTVFEMGGRKLAFSMIRNISDRKRVEEEREVLRQQLLQAQKMEAIGQLAGGVAHDFNNMLTIIMGNANLAMMDRDPGDKDYEVISEIIDAANRSRALTMKMLTFARKDKLNIRKTNVKDIAWDLNALLERSFDKKIIIRLSVEEDIFVDVDKNQIEQALLNICMNARDAMPGGGTISIKAYKTNMNGEVCRQCGRSIRGEFCRIDVEDTGVGIPDSMVDKVFEPFFTTKDVGKGTGLGLSVTYGVVHSHGGHTYMKSSISEGTLVSIVIPLSKCPKKEEPAEASEISTGSETILVIDDEPGVLKLAGRMLRNAGYKIYEASSGGEGIELFGTLIDSIDLVVLDMIMPDMDGKDVYVKLKEMKSDVGVLLFSGYSEDGVAEKLLEEENVRGFLQKPFMVDEICGAVRAALDS
ncbi:MAG TPA: PAS domain S-box protein [bacterium]|nr:PAS domain S-box protein [bacterium]